ncbi:hypothetical protein Vadar_018453 [Vaccinium darrowii]|uniref:Uncharacterized protein n=1 Tax=Vaccinium darrowii TaxID=229202 RepID=A0ACB7Z5L6_9ERIC|nr:hypothetical protein Vadar_018453 [Vaccinium darrowii]
MTSMARYGILSSGYNLMSFYASQTHESFQRARQVEHEMTSSMREHWEMVKKQHTTEDGGPSSVGSLFGVGDPVKVKTKGNPGKKFEEKQTRKGRKCKTIGHDKRTCPKLKSKEELIMQTRQSQRVDASKDVAGPSQRTNTHKRKAGATTTMKLMATMMTRTKVKLMPIMRRMIKVKVVVMTRTMVNSLHSYGT